MATDSPILLQKDNTFTKLFVGGLPYHTTDETLRAYFLQFGEIEEAVVIYDRVTRKSKGYGFVTMADREAAERAFANPNPVIEGRRANVNLAYIGAKPKMHCPPDSPMPGLHSPTDLGNDPAFFTQGSPPPLPFGIQTQGFIISGPGCPPLQPSAPRPHARTAPLPPLL